MNRIKMPKKEVSVIWMVVIILAIFFCVSLFFSMIIALFVSDGGLASNVALIPIKGVITVEGGDGWGASYTSSRDIVNFIEEADESPYVKAIVFDINSPGGSPVASKEIADAIKRTKKPTISVIREMGASGAYWIASATDHIIANELSMTGSIGVISSYVEFAEFIDQHNVTYRRLVAGERKDIGDPFKELSSEEEAIMQDKLDKIHNYFIAAVSANRNLSMEKTRKLATGEVFLGVEALEFGLVDEVGDMTVAKKRLKDTLNITDVEFAEYKTAESFFDILTGVMSDHSFMIGKGLGTALTEGNAVSIRT